MLIGQLAGTTAKTLRFYEDAQLLPSRGAPYRATATHLGTTTADAARIKELFPRRGLSLRGSSTRDCRGSGVHRRPP